MELCKFIASFFVVFIHIRFPGEFGTVIDCIARFAVPTFFAISGYFSFRVISEKLSSRISYMFRLNFIATLVYFLWNVYDCIAISGKDVMQMLKANLSLESMARWLILNKNPFAVHLWYLSAIFICYILLWLYVRFFDDDADYRPFYAVSFILFVFFILFSAFTAKEQMQYHYTVYRNGLFFGLPMFGLGMFLREYSERIITMFRMTALKEILCIVFGLVISLIQYKGLGKTEMPVGMVITVIGLMLFMASRPTVPFMENHSLFFVFLGKISLIIYIIHLALNYYLKSQPAFADLCQMRYAYPLLVVGLSAICGLILTVFSVLFRKIRPKKRR